VDPSVAMTGEVTLTRQVLPVGGIKEKVLAARAAGITRVFLPDRNKPDVEEIEDQSTLSGLQFCFVDHVSSVLDQILVSPRKRKPKTVCVTEEGTAATRTAKPRANASRPGKTGARKDGRAT